MTDELGWHLTASWADVRTKARRIRSEGGVRLLVARPSQVVAHVRGDTEVYETRLTRVPGRAQAVAMWECACPWAAYSWGRTGRWRRFEGRMCSHALATQYEAQSRGMMGREVHVDREHPHWLDPMTVRQPGSYDRGTGKHSMRRSAEFEGRVDGAVVPLELHPGHGVVGPQGPVEPESVTHPNYHPDLGLVLAAKDEAPEAPTHAGLVLKARDTGRVLMLQRSVKDEKDPAAGTWEFPGGGMEPDDHNSLHGAMREWEEEVGQRVPPGGVLHHTWTSGNGVYQGHVMVIPSEDLVSMRDGRVTVNPDDPGGDDHEQAAWWDPEHARKNPALREECKASPWKEIKMAGQQQQQQQQQHAAGFSTWASSPSTDEFGDLGPPPAVESGVDDDPDHALPVTYGDADQRLAARVEAELRPRVAARGTLVYSSSSAAFGPGDDRLYQEMRRTALRDFTPAEQRAMIEEGAGGVRAANLDRLDLTGTHYALMPETDENEWGVV